MADKTITDRWKSVQAIASAVYQNDDKAVSNLTELFLPDLEDGEQLPDWKLDQHLKVRRLERLWNALDASHDALTAKRHELRRLRRVLDDASSAVYSRLLSLKRVLTGIRPRRAAQERWLEGKLPRANNPYELHQGAQVARGSLQEMEPARSKTGGFDPEAWSKELESEAKTLNRAIDDETMARREVEGLRIDTAEPRAGLAVPAPGLLQALRRRGSPARASRLGRRLNGARWHLCYYCPVPRNRTRTSASSESFEWIRIMARRKPVAVGSKPTRNAHEAPGGKTLPEQPSTEAGRVN